MIENLPSDEKLEQLSKTLQIPKEDLDRISDDANAQDLNLKKKIEDQKKPKPKVVHPYILGQE